MPMVKTLVRWQVYHGSGRYPGASGSSCSGRTTGERRDGVGVSMKVETYTLRTATRLTSTCTYCLLCGLDQTCADDAISSENGVVCPNENELPREQAINDDFRIGYLESYADQIALKIAEGIPIKSYLMWAWTVCAAETRTR